MQFFGNSANVHWRAVSWEDLRTHPLYEELPPTHAVRVESARDLSRFRQDGWQWTALHHGRLTTSKLAAVLGFYESTTGAALRIPLSLCGHERAVGAWNEVRRKPPSDWSHLNAEHDTHSAHSTHSGPREGERETPSPSRTVWVAPSSSSHNEPTQRVVFSHTYTPTADAHGSVTSSESAIRTPSDARLAWGAAQEATGLLAVLNALPALPLPLSLSHAACGEREREQVQSRLCEAGMLTIEALRDQFTHTDKTSASLPRERERESLYLDVLRGVFEEHSLPLLGASPDGLVHHHHHITLSHNAASSIEVVEVKCSSPFAAARGAENVLRINSLRAQHDSVPVWHVPQLQLEIFCAGPQCESVLVLVLFVDGARIYRLQRNDEYIRQMLSFVKEFYVKYVQSVPSNKMKAPPENFFLASKNKLYADFLKLTTSLAQHAELVKELAHDEVQRSPFNDQFFLS